jgi:DNA-binding IclR family transcriptional regulator
MASIAVRPTAPFVVGRARAARLPAVEVAGQLSEDDQAGRPYATDCDRQGRTAQDSEDDPRNRVVAHARRVHEGVSAFAAPIFDRSGQVIAAFALASPTSRAVDKAETFAVLVKKAAGAISSVMGYGAGQP